MPEDNIPDLLTGIYRHYKGPLYQVLGFSHNASNEDKPQVLYIGLQLDGSHPGPRFATRDVDEFLGEVCVCEEHYGMAWHSEEHHRQMSWDHSASDIRERFEYLGPVYQPGMEHRREESLDPEVLAAVADYIEAQANTDSFYDQIEQRVLDAITEDEVATKVPWVPATEAAIAGVAAALRRPT